MTLLEALGQGAEVAAVGLIIVFSVLIILMLVMMLMKVIFYKPESKQKPQSAAPAAASPAPTAQPVQSINEAELIAVLTAAVAASMNTSTYHLNIKSYRRIDDASPAWNKAGRRDVIDARF